MNIERSDLMRKPVETSQNDELQPRRLTLRKGEKLRHRSLVDSLFRHGDTIYEFPLRLTWREVDEETLEKTFRDKVPEKIGPLQMLVTVPKKKRRYAVDRVLMRRRIREAYRLNRLPLKDLVEEEEGIRTLGMAIVYIHDKNLPYSVVEQKMKVVLRRLASKIKSGLKKEALQEKKGETSKPEAER